MNSRFTKQPCGTCQTDTLHYVHKCSVCGEAKSLTPLRDARRALAAKLGADALAAYYADARRRLGIRKRGFAYGIHRVMKPKVEGV